MDPIRFYSSSLSFLAGTLVFSFADADPALLGAFALFSAAGLSAPPVRRMRAGALVLCVIASFALGSLRIELAESGPHPLDARIGKKISLSGSVCGEPIDKGSLQTLCFKPDGYTDRVLVTAGAPPLYRYGDNIVFLGSLGFPKNFVSYEGGPEFDYVSYLAKDSVRYTAFRPKLAKAAGNRTNPILSALFRIKGAFVAKMGRLIPEPESALLGGLLLGDRRSMPAEVAEDFKRAGLVHMLVLSGYNVTIIAESLMRAFSFLPRPAALSSGALSIVLFALMTGASSTTVRAAIMAVIAIGARSWGRRYDVTRALVLAAVAMVAENPLILAFDVSFELSFLATLALLFVSPLISDRLGFVTDRLKLRETLSTTLATQIFVLPFILYVMGQTSVISLASNPIILPAVPYSMLGGFVAVLIGFVSERLASPAAWATGLFLDYILKGTALFARLPFAMIRMSASIGMLALSYAVYVAALIWLWRRKRRL